MKGRFFLVASRLKKRWLILMVLALLGAISFAPQKVSAKSTFFETMGISIAVGTVLGASTLPFYDDPMSNLKTNLAIGAAAGLVLGLGVWFLWPSEEEFVPGEQGGKFKVYPDCLISSHNVQNLAPPGFENILSSDFLNISKTNSHLSLYSLSE